MNDSLRCKGKGDYSVAEDEGLDNTKLSWGARVTPETSLSEKRTSCYFNQLETAIS